MDKKKKYLLIGIGVVILITLLANISSCDNDEVKETKEIVLKAAQTEIKGELKGCYEVVDKNYKVKFAKKSYEMEHIPAINSRGYYSVSAGSYKYLEDAQGEEAEWINKYQILQYNNLFGREGQSKQFFPYMLE